MCSFVLKVITFICVIIDTSLKKMYIGMDVYEFLTSALTGRWSFSFTRRPQNSGERASDTHGIED
jgi:hypothetical protein